MVPERAGWICRFLWEGDLLGSYPRTSCQSVQSDSFAQEDFADGTADGSAVFDGGESLAFIDVPFDSRPGS